MRDYKSIHEDAYVVDWHTHLSLKTAVFHRDLCKDYKRRLFHRTFWPMVSRTDFPKMIDGGVDVSLSVCYIPEMEWADDLPAIKIFKWLRRPVWKRLFGAKTYFDASVDAFDDVEAQIRRANSDRYLGKKVVLCKTPEILKANLSRDRLCVVHAIEGGHSLQGSYLGKYYDPELPINDQAKDEVLGNLQYFKDRGCAYLTLAHFYQNYLASPVFPYPEYASKFARWGRMLESWDTCKGLSYLGEVVVRKCFELGIIVDVCHCTPLARAKVYEIAEQEGAECQVIASHVGAYGVHSDQYNLEDWEIKWIADHGGVVSVILMNYWLAAHHSKLGLNEFSEVVRHIVDVGGEDCVSLGTDFDGFTDPPDEVPDMRELPALTMRLASETADGGVVRYDDGQLHKFLGGNALRVLSEGWR